MRRSKESIVNEIENKEVYNFFYNRLLTLALSQFEYHGLPETVDRRYMERMLLFNGQCALLKPYENNHDLDFWLGLNFTPRGEFNIYGYPRDIYGYGYYNAPIETRKFYIIYDNNLRQTLLPHLKFMAKAMYEIYQTYRANLKHQRTPYIITASKNQKLTVDIIVQKIEKFFPFIELRDGFDPAKSIQALNTNVPYHGTEMLENLKTVWNLALGLLGISPEPTKKERLLDGETQMIRQESNIASYSRLMSRIEIFDKFNEREGYDVSINLTSFTSEDLALPIPESTIAERAISWKG